MEAMATENLIWARDSFTNVRQQYSHLDDATVLAILTSIAHTSAMILSCTFYVLLNHFQIFPQWRTQRKQPDETLSWKAFLHCIFYHFVTFPLGMYFVGAPLLDKLNPNSLDPSRFPVDIKTWLGWLLVSIAVEDTLFYWGHRALHHKSIYRFIHKQHHQFKVNSVWAFEYAHPIELMVANAVPVSAGFVIVQSHGLILPIFAWMQVCEATYAHSNYELPFMPFAWCLSIQGGAARHEFHHSHNVGSYGSWTKFWDWVCGTDAAFYRYQEEQAAEKRAAKSK